MCNLARKDKTRCFDLEKTTIIVISCTRAEYLKKENCGWAEYWGDWLKTGFITTFFGCDEAKNSSIQRQTSGKTFSVR